MARAPAPRTESASWRTTLLVAVAVAALAGAIAWMSMGAGGTGKDFTLPWTAARHMLAGRDPYVAMRPTGVYPFNVPFYYPLPAALLAAPFAALPASMAGIAFVALSFGVAAAALVRENTGRLVILFGFPAVMAATLGQWSPLLLASTLVPALQIVMPVKPTIGAAVFASRPSRLGLALAIGIVALSFAILPGWLGSWRAAVASAWEMYTPPVRWAGGAGLVVLAAVVWWRDRDARLLVVMALAPQLPLFYDQLLVHAVARTRREAWALVALGWAGGLAWALQGSPSGAGERPARTLILLTIYVPALVVVARRWYRERGHK